MADVIWAFEFETQSATASKLVGLAQRATFRRAAAVEPTPVFAFASEEAYLTVRDYVFAATPETVTAGSLKQNTPYYRERPPTGISSFVVKVTPASSGATGAIWAVIQGGSDASSASGSRYALEIDLFVLADRPDYADHAAVEAALGTEVV